MVGYQNHWQTNNLVFRNQTDIRKMQLLQLKGVLQLSAPDFLEIFRTARERYGWKDTQAPQTFCRNSFLLKKRSVLNEKDFFRYASKPLIIPFRSPISSVQGWNVEDFAIFPAVFKMLAVFRVLIFLSIFNAVFKTVKMHSNSKFFGFGIFFTTI